MKLITEEGHIDLLKDESDLFQAKPKLVLPTPTLEIRENEPFREFHKGDNLFGSKRLFMEEIDDIVFSESSLLLRNLSVEFPYNIEIDEEFILVLDGPIYNIKAKTTDSFYLPLLDRGRYFFKNDFLDFYYKHFNKQQEIIRVRFTADAYVLSQKDIIVGWGLNNASTYLYSWEKEKYDKLILDNRRNLADFLSIYSEETFKKMNEKNPLIKKEMLRIYENALKAKSSAICETILDWLSGHYRDDPVIQKLNEEFEFLD